MQDRQKLQPARNFQQSLDHGRGWGSVSCRLLKLFFGSSWTVCLRTAGLEGFRSFWVVVLNCGVGFVDQS